MCLADVFPRSEQICLITENIICPFTILNLDVTQEELLNKTCTSINNTGEIVQGLETFTGYRYLKTLLPKVYEIKTSTCSTSNILVFSPGDSLLYFPNPLSYSSFKYLIKWDILPWWKEFVLVQTTYRRRKKRQALSISFKESKETKSNAVKMQKCPRMINTDNSELPLLKTFVFCHFF